MSYVIELPVSSQRKRIAMERRHKQLERDFYNVKLCSIHSPIAGRLYCVYQDEINELENALR